MEIIGFIMGTIAFIMVMEVQEKLKKMKEEITELRNQMNIQDPTEINLEKKEEEK